jgi:hypothetical protein
VTFAEARDSQLPFLIGTPRLHSARGMNGVFWYTDGTLYNWDSHLEEWVESMWNFDTSLQLASMGLWALDYFEEREAPHSPQPEPECRCVTLLSGHWQGCHMAKLSYM